AADRRPSAEPPPAQPHPLRIEGKAPLGALAHLLTWQALLRLPMAACDRTYHATQDPRLPLFLAGAIPRRLLDALDGRADRLSDLRRRPFGLCDEPRGGGVPARPARPCAVRPAVPAHAGRGLGSRQVRPALRGRLRQSDRLHDRAGARPAYLAGSVEPADPVH